MNKCIICHQSLYEIGAQKGYKILKCKGCGMGYTEQGIIQKSSYHRDDTYIEEKQLFKNIFQKRINIISKFKKRGNVLEIGCSTGLMLSLLKKRGWEVTGVEISEKAAEIARKRGIKIIAQPFETALIKDKFDLIIFNHTLEHLKNPRGVFKKTILILEDNGIIYIDLPNFDSLSARIYGVRWPMLLPEEHRWHFTLKSLSLLLEELDFRVLFVERASGIWDYNNPLKGILISLINFKKRFFIEIITALPSWIMWKIGKGSDLMVITKKT